MINPQDYFRRKKEEEQTASKTPSQVAREQNSINSNDIYNYYKTGTLPNKTEVKLDSSYIDRENQRRIEREQQKARREEITDISKGLAQKGINQAEIQRYTFGDKNTKPSDKVLDITGRDNIGGEISSDYKPLSKEEYAYQKEEQGFIARLLNTLNNANEKIKSVFTGSKPDYSTGKTFLDPAPENLSKSENGKPIVENRLINRPIDFNYDKFITDAYNLRTDSENRIKEINKELQDFGVMSPDLTGLSFDEKMEAIKNAKPTMARMRGNNRLARIYDELANQEYIKYVTDQIIGNQQVDAGFLQGIVRTLKYNGERVIPDLGIMELVNSLEKRNAIYKERNGEELTPHERSIIDRDRAEVMNMMIERGMWDQIGQMVIEMPAYVIEFATTGKIFNYLVGGAAGGAVLKSQAKEGLKTIPNFIAGNVVNNAANSIKGLITSSSTYAVAKFGQTMGFAPQIAADAIEYTLPSALLVKGEQGDKYIQHTGEGDSWLVALTKATMSMYAEVLSEDAGKLVGFSKSYGSDIGKAANTRINKELFGKEIVERMAVFTPEPEKIIQKGIIGKVVEKLKLREDSVITEYLRKAGWDGVFEEVFEEEVAEITQSIIEGREYYPIWTPEGIERLVTNTLGIGIFGGMSKVSSEVVNQITSNKNRSVIEFPIKDIDTKNNPYIESLLKLAVTGGGSKPDDVKVNEVLDLFNSISENDPYLKDFQDYLLDIGLNEQDLEKMSKGGNIDILLNNIERVATTEYDAPPQPVIYHGNDTAREWKTDPRGNINFATDKQHIAETFAAGDTSNIIDLDLKDFNIKRYETKDEMFKVAANKELKEELVDRGVDIIIAENHALGINPQKIAEVTGIPLREDFRQKTVQELQAERDAREAEEEAKAKEMVNVLDQVRDDTTFDYVADQRQKNINDTLTYVADLMRGEKEDTRFTNIGIFKEIVAANGFPKNTQITDTVEVYKASVKEIQAGDYVTFDRARAEAYAKDRPNSKIYSKEVAFVDLLSAASKRDAIFAPKDSILKSSTPKKAKVLSKDPVKQRQELSQISKDIVSELNKMFDGKTRLSKTEKDQAQRYVDSVVDSYGGSIQSPIVNRDILRVGSIVLYPALTAEEIENKKKIINEQMQDKEMRIKLNSFSKFVDHIKSKLIKNRFVVNDISSRFSNSRYIEISDKNTGELKLTIRYSNHDLPVGYGSARGDSDLYWSTKNSGMADSYKTIVDAIEKLNNTKDDIIEVDIDTATNEEQRDRDIRDNNTTENVPEYIPDGNEQSGGLQREDKASGTEDVPTRTEQPAVTTVGDSPTRVRPSNDKTITPKTIAARKKLNATIESIVDSKGNKYLDPNEYTQEEKAIMREYTGYGGTGAKEKKGVLDEFYTPQEVVDLTYAALNREISIDQWRNIKDILEPAVGIGAFVQNSPFHTSRFTGYEISKTSAAIAQALNPDSIIYHEDFGMQFIASGTPAKLDDKSFEKYDLVVGNPPYYKFAGTLSGMGEGLGAKTYQEYFILRGLHSLKEGGYLAMVVPSTFLDSPKSDTKKLISGMVDYLRAYRLPNGIFQGTDIGTDLLILKKKAYRSSYFLNDDLQNKNYFQGSRKENILGTERLATNKYGKEVTVVDGDLSNVKQMVEKLNQQNSIEKVDDPIERKRDNIKPETTIKETKPKKEDVAFVKKITIKHRGTTGIQKVGTEIDINSMDYKLVFNTKASGLLNESFVDTMSEEDRLQYLSFRSEGWIIDSLYTHNYNLHDLLKELEQARSYNYISKEQYEKQKKLIDKAMLPQARIDQIKVSPKAKLWRRVNMYDIDGQDMGISVYDGFFSYLNTLDSSAFGGIARDNVTKYLLGTLKASNNLTQEENSYIKNNVSKVTNNLFGAYLEYIATNNPTQAQIIENEFNYEHNAYRIQDLSKLPLIVDINTHLEKDGQKWGFRLNKAQREAIGFLVSKGRGINALDVGVGKTMSTIVAMAETMERGWAKRAMVILPNPSILEQWVKEIKSILPSATIYPVRKSKDILRFKNVETEEKSFILATTDILNKFAFREDTFKELEPDIMEMIMNVGGEKTARQEELEKQKIYKMFGVVMKGKADPKDRIYFEDTKIDMLTIDEGHNYNHVFSRVPTAKELVGDKWVKRANDYNSLTVNPSARGIKAFFLSRLILKKNDNRNVFMLTATPFQNNPLEIYTMLQYVGKDEIEKRGLNNIADFVDTYMNITRENVITPNGQIKQADVVKSFKNYSSFTQLLNSNMIKIDGEEAGVIRPKKVVNKIIVNSSPKQFYRGIELSEQYLKVIEEIKGKNGEERKELMGKKLSLQQLLNINGYSQFASTDLRPKDYKDFIENSPRLKAVMEIIKNNKKDNPKGQSLIYQAWKRNNKTNVEYIPLIREYLVKELGYKPSEIGEITGTVKEAERIETQEKYNKGEIKIIIGNNAMVEGLNLNKWTTDIFIVTPFWNYTGFSQMVGRGWRQGNNWENIRINLLLGRDTGDVFITEKLIQKEAREREVTQAVRNGRYVEEVEGDEISFDDMMDQLLTDPVARLQLTRDKEIESLSSEYAGKSAYLSLIKGVYDRPKRERYKSRIASLEDDITGETIMLKKYTSSIKETTDEEQIKNLKDRITSKRDVIAGQKRKLSSLQNELNRLEEVEAKEQITQEKIDMLQKELDSMSKMRSDIDNKYKEMMEQAEIERSKRKPIDNDFGKIVENIREMNSKGFYRLREDDIKKETGSVNRGGKYGDLGGYSDIKSVEKSLGNIVPLGNPELLSLYKTISGGQMPKLTNRFTRKLGQAYGLEIKLARKITKDPELLGKVFAHEIGHIFDYIPDGTLRRGNIVGRVATLNSYLQDMHESLNNKELKQELKELSLKWKPFDPSIDKKYTQYRFSSVEMYADAVSVLLNDPYLLQREAPLFYDAFFKFLEKKPVVEKAFFEVMAAMRDPELKYERREQEINQMYQRAEEKYQALIADKVESEQSFMFKLKYMFVDKGQLIAEKVRAKEKAGVKVEPKSNPILTLEALDYIDGMIKNFAEEHYGSVYKDLKRNGISWEDFGTVLFLERVMNERGEMANPLNFDVQSAREQYEGLKNKMTREGVWNALMSNLAKFRQGTQKVVSMAKESGFYNENLIEQMEANPSYATFQVIDYMDSKITAAIHEQVGTFKDIANAATSTIVKSLVTIRAIEYNNAKKTIVSFIKKEYGDEIKETEYLYNTSKKRQEIDERGLPQNKQILRVIEDGKLRGYIVDKYIALAVNGRNHDSLRELVRIIQKPNSIQRALFTSLSVGFQTTNFVRDFMRTWKNMPDKNLGEVLLSMPKLSFGYLRAMYPSAMKALDIKNAVISEMENKKIIGIGYHSGFTPRDNAETMIESTLNKAGVSVLPSQKTNIFIKPFKMLIEGIEMLGNFVEALPKVATYQMYKDKIDEPILRNYIINNFGSPNFRARGDITFFSNNLFMFSNAMLQSWKADIKIATQPTTRSGYWLKTALSVFIPKLLMYAALYGVFGDDIEEMMRDVSEYDRMNYHIIPLYKDANTNKTVYLRIPNDEGGRFIGGLFWKAINIKELKFGDLATLFEYSADQLPGLAPSIEGIGAIITYLGGNNPYDNFRQRNVIPDTEFKAGTEYSFPIFLDWLLKSQGAHIVAPRIITEPPDRVSTLERGLALPVINGILGRWIKVSDQGRHEELWDIQREASAKDAEAQIKNERKLSELMVEYDKSDRSRSTIDRLKGEYIEYVVGSDRSDAASKQKAAYRDKQFEQTIVARYDPNVKMLRNKNKNLQLELLKSMKSKMDYIKYKNMLETAKDAGIISNPVYEESI